MERLRRKTQYEEVYLHAYSDGLEAEISSARFRGQLSGACRCECTYSDVLLLVVDRAEGTDR
ncbi:protein of unknown function [Cyanobium sp. NIES-981]|nr:protein of unknown function [Cyanobium sp. NIES-981]